MFLEAERQAHRSSSNYRVGAVVADKRVLARGRNSDKSHTTIFKSKYANAHTLMHAEIDAMIRSVNSYKKDVFVVRVKKNGERALARPCALCLFVLRGQGVGRVFYTIGPGEYGVLKP